METAQKLQGVVRILVMAVDELGHELRKLRLGDGLSTAKVATSPALRAAMGCLPADAKQAEERLRLAIDELADDRQRLAISNAYALGDARSRASLGTVERRRRFADKVGRSVSSINGDEQRAVETLVAALRGPKTQNGMFATRTRVEITDGRVVAVALKQAFRLPNGSVHDREQEWTADAGNGNNLVVLQSDSTPLEEMSLHVCFHGLLPPELMFYHYEDLNHWTVNKAEWWARYEFLNGNTNKELTFRPRANRIYVLLWSVPITVSKEALDAAMSNVNAGESVTIVG